MIQEILLEQRQSKETAESASCSWELRILKERSSFVEGNYDTEAALVQNEEKSSPFVLKLPQETSDHDDTPYTKKTVNSNSYFTVDHCKTPASNKENDKECDMNMSSSEPNVTFLCKTNVNINNQTSKLQMMKKRDIPEIDDFIGSLKETNKRGIDSKTLSDGPKISECSLRTTKNKLIPTQNQQGLTDNNWENNKMCSHISVDKVSSSESNKKEVQEQLVSSCNTEKTSRIKSRGMMGVTRKVIDDYFVSL